MAKRPGKDFLAVEFVREQLEAAVASAAKDYADLLHGDLFSQLNCSTGDGDTSDRWHLWFDSPLETAYWVWWRALGDRDSFCERDIELVWHAETVADGNRYVIDAAVACTAGSGAERDYVRQRWPLIGIELDGHAFHEKTLEQVTYRNHRDRTLQRAGWTIFHYSFDEFRRDPSMCVIEPMDHARANYARLLSEYRQQQRMKRSAGTV